MPSDEIIAKSAGKLEDFALLQFSGAQTAAFLQGQFTCDVRSIAPGEAILGACCDHKGRVLFNGWLGQVATETAEFLLFLPKNMLAAAIAHLQKFAVFSKVRLAEKTGWATILYCGETLEELPASSLHWRLPLIHSQMLHWFAGPKETMQAFLNTLAAHASPLTPDLHAQLMVTAGLVYIEPTTRELFIPQMLNLEKLGGVSFNKGCYVGQEIVARTQHLGQLKRHLYQIKIASETPVQIGEPLVNAQNEVLGQIAAVSIASPGHYELLAVVQDRGLEELASVYNLLTIDPQHRHCERQ